MTFADHDPADSYDPTAGPPDPLQVARRLHDIGHELAVLAGRDDTTRFHNLPDDYRDLAVAIVVILLGWLERQGHTWAPST